MKKLKQLYLQYIKYIFFSTLAPHLSHIVQYIYFWQRVPMFLERSSRTCLDANKRATTANTNG